MRISPYIANEMYLRYADASETDPDGATTLLPEGVYTKLAAAKYIKDNDKDHDGVLSSDEVSLSPEAYAALDANADGSVSLSEMERSLKGQDNAIFAYYKNGGAASEQKDVASALLEDATSTSNASANSYVKLAAKSYIAAGDTDGDGQLVSSEAALAPNVFAKIDSNADGRLNASELQSALADKGDSICKYYKNGGTRRLSELTSNLLATI
jgi:Ca2+-binding EF-hand superfamily protein